MIVIAMPNEPCKNSDDSTMSLDSITTVDILLLYTMYVSSQSCCITVMHS